MSQQSALKLMVHVKSIRSDHVSVLISDVSEKLKSVVNQNIFALDVYILFNIIDEQIFTACTIILFYCMLQSYNMWTKEPIH